MQPDATYLVAAEGDERQLCFREGDTTARILMLNVIDETVKEAGSSFINALKQVIHS